jgi:serine/threonine protein kinase
MHEASGPIVFDQTEQSENQPFDSVFKTIKTNVSQVFLGRIAKPLLGVPIRVGQKVAIKEARDAMDDHQGLIDPDSTDPDYELQKQIDDEQDFYNGILEDEIAAIPFLKEIFGDDFDWMFLALYSYQYKDRLLLVGELTQGTLDDLYQIVMFGHAEKMPDIDISQMKGKLQDLLYLAQLMMHFHLNGITVNDVKLSNTMKKEDGSVVFTDFSKKTMKEGLFSVNKRAELISLLYSPLFVSEVTRLSTDIYGFVCIIYEMLTGFKMEPLSMNYKNKDYLTIIKDILEMRLSQSKHVTLLLRYLFDLKYANDESKSFKEFYDEKIEDLTTFFLDYFDQDAFKATDFKIKKVDDGFEVPQELDIKKVMERLFSLLEAPLISDDNPKEPWQITWPSDPNNQAMAQALAE